MRENESLPVSFAWERHHHPGCLAMPIPMINCIFENNTANDYYVNNNDNTISMFSVYEISACHPHRVI